MEEKMKQEENSLKSTREKPECNLPPSMPSDTHKQELVITICRSVYKHIHSRPKTRGSLSVLINV